MDNRRMGWPAALQPEGRTATCRPESMVRYMDKKWHQGWEKRRDESLFEARDMTDIAVKLYGPEPGRLVNGTDADAKQADAETKFIDKSRLIEGAVYRIEVLGISAATFSRWLGQSMGWSIWSTAAKNVSLTSNPSGRSRWKAIERVMPSELYETGAVYEVYRHSLSDVYSKWMGDCWSPWNMDPNVVAKTASKLPLWWEFFPIRKVMPK